MCVDEHTIDKEEKKGKMWRNSWLDMELEVENRPAAGWRVICATLVALCTFAGKKKPKGS